LLVLPGFLITKLPSRAPTEPESIEKITNDVEQLIIPGVSIQDVCLLFYL